MIHSFIIFFSVQSCCRAGCLRCCTRPQKEEMGERSFTIYTLIMSRHVLEAYTQLEVGTGGKGVAG